MIFLLTRKSNPMENRCQDSISRSTAEPNRSAMTSHCSPRFTFIGSWTNLVSCSLLHKPMVISVCLPDLSAIVFIWRRSSCSSRQNVGPATQTAKCVTSSLEGINQGGVLGICGSSNTLTRGTRGPSCMRSSLIMWTTPLFLWYNQPFHTEVFDPPFYGWIS